MFLLPRIVVCGLAASCVLAAAPKRPFVITFQEASYRTNADGSTQGEPLPPGVTVSLKARQADGSIAEASYQGGNIDWRKVASVAQGQRTAIFTRSHTRTSLPLQPSELAELKASPADAGCRVHPERVSASEIVGVDTFQGLQVVKHRFDPPGGTVIIELWEAPALDCEIVLGKTYFRGRGGQIESVTIKAASRIELREPEAALFDTAAGGAQAATAGR